MLVGRNADKLKKAEQEVKKANNKIKTKTYQFDFTKNSRIEDYTKLEADLSDLDISILVNMAGIIQKNSLADCPVELLKEITETNVNGVGFLSKIFCDRFMKREKRSAIINISSQSGYAPCPLSATYGASKAYIRSFTKAMGYEVSDKVDVMVHSPGYVHTSMTNFPTGHNVAEPIDCCKAIFRDIGYERENSPIIAQEFEVFYVMNLFKISESFVLYALYKMFKADMEKERKTE